MSGPNPEHKVILPVLLIILVLAAVYSARRVQVQKEEERRHPYTLLARRLDALKNREWCDERMQAKRLYVTAVVDRFRPQIENLFQSADQKPGEAVPTVDLGLVKLRIYQPKKEILDENDSTWSWEDAYGLIQKIQLEENEAEQHRNWRDVDAMARYLLEKDSARLYGKNLSGENHLFQPNSTVSRTGPKEFTVEMDPGDFFGHQDALAKILESEWSGNGYHLRLKWTRGDPKLYHFSAYLQAGRSYVSHPKKSVEIANLAWTKVVAHELGHVLGFADHYYNLWDANHCYYTQKSRRADLMSNSEDGKISLRHWEILDQAYPWKKERALQPFNYVFEAGKTAALRPLEK